MGCVTDTTGCVVLFGAVQIPSAAFPAEQVDFLVEVLERLSEEAGSLGLHVSLVKIEIQSLGNILDNAVVRPGVW